MTVNTHFFFGPNIYKKQHGARPCVEKMQFIFFVPPNEELRAPPKIWMYPQNEGKRVHVPLDEKTCGHTDADLKTYDANIIWIYCWFFFMFL